MDALLHSYGTGQLDAFSGDIAKLFHEAVILISILRPSSSHSKVPRSSWHAFLDDLSWLCDTQSGGQTVTSVGAEQMSHAVRFWICANGRVKLRSLTHLKWILSELQKLASNSELVAGDVEVQILDAAVRSSHERVGDYLRKLQIHVERVSVQGACVGEGNVKLLEDLHAMLEKRGDFRDLCRSAYCFRLCPSYRSLRQKIKQDSVLESWAYIRHYIGRLASWSGASKRVVQMAKTSPHLFEGHEVMIVGQDLESLSWVPIPTAEFQKAMDDVRQSLHERLLDRGTGVMRLGTASAASIAVFLEKRRHHKFVPIVHAEILMLEHFYLNNLSFTGGDRYIGCSKPSCYCCEMYMQFHPARIRARPCHGNAWAQWSPPVAINEGPDTHMRHSLAILCRMLNRLHHDIRTHILSASSPGARGFDSTTGFS